MIYLTLINLLLILLTGGILYRFGKYMHYTQEKLKRYETSFLTIKMNMEKIGLAQRSLQEQQNSLISQIQEEILPFVEHLQQVEEKQKITDYYKNLIAKSHRYITAYHTFFQQQAIHFFLAYLEEIPFNIEIFKILLDFGIQKKDIEIIKKAFHFFTLHQHEDLLGFRHLLQREDVQILLSKLVAIPGTKPILEPYYFYLPPYDNKPIVKSFDIQIRQNLPDYVAKNILGD